MPRCQGRHRRHRGLLNLPYRFQLCVPYGSGHAAATGAASAVATRAMDGGLLPDFACVRFAVRRSPHAHKEA